MKSDQKVLFFLASGISARGGITFNSFAEDIANVLQDICIYTLY
jgi:hypothetical protein